MFLANRFGCDETQWQIKIRINNHNRRSQLVAAWVRERKNDEHNVAFSHYRPVLNRRQNKRPLLQKKKIKSPGVGSEVLDALG